MPEQVTKKAGTSKQDEHEEHAASASTLAKRGEHLKADIDDLLDEIDGVLEENAEEFVSSYVQRGGQ